MAKEGPDTYKNSCLHVANVVEDFELNLQWTSISLSVFCGHQVEDMSMLAPFSQRQNLSSRTIFLIMDFEHLGPSLKIFNKIKLINSRRLQITTEI